VQLTKAMLRGDVARTIDLIDREADVFVQRTHSPEMQEALNAFAEKRAPDFSRFDRT
jgi:enoyl-CoA hydratase/carnithine racemase